MRVTLCFFCLVLLTVGNSCRADTPRYRLIILPLNFNGWNYLDYSGHAGGVNAQGQIVGMAPVKSPKGQDDRTAMWQRGHPLRVLDKSPDLYVNNEDTRDFLYPTGINVHGKTIGVATYQADGASLSQSCSSCFFWNGRITGLGSEMPQKEDTFNAALGINDRGEIVGAYAYDDDDPPNIDAPPTPVDHSAYAFLWRHGRARALWRGVAVAINNHDWIVGTLPDPGSPPAHPAVGILWRNGHIRHLPMQPDAINDDGEIAGKVPLNDDDGKACLWRQGHVIRLSQKISNAAALNNRGQAVGFIRGPIVGSQSRAVLWQQGQGYDLNRCATLRKGWVLAEAIGINDHGWIIGRGDIYRTPKDKEAYKSFTYLLIPR